jgi:putative SOS response-associated peptidase YedK
VVERYTHLAIGEFPRRFNVAHGQLAPVTCDGVLAGRRWGLLSPWRGHGGVRPPSIYDVSVHALDAKPVLRRARHGLVHADGFYTWRQLPGGKARPFWLHGDDR